MNLSAVCHAVLLVICVLIFCLVLMRLVNSLACLSGSLLLSDEWSTNSVKAVLALLRIQKVSLSIYRVLILVSVILLLILLLLLVLLALVSLRLLFM